MENSMEAPQKLNIELPYDQAIPLLGVYPKELKAGARRDICITVFIAMLFTTVKSCKQSKCPQTDKWIKKMWYMHTMENYSALKKKKILSHATTCLILEYFMVS